VVERSHHPNRPAVIGHVTASCFSPNLERSIALALVVNGRSRYAESVDVTGPGFRSTATITAPVFIDVAGERMRG
jgi:sarcosine oxidase subunit alpha